MEKLVITLTAILLSTFFVYAQEDYDAGMNHAFELWENGKMEEATEKFTALGNSQNNWLPFYYASRIKISEAFSNELPERKELLLSEAQHLLDNARDFSSQKNVEVMVLQALIHTGYITIDPPRYGGILLPKVNQIYRTALELEPTNPRVAFCKAEWHIGKAPYIGEDPTIYCDDLRESLQLFSKDKPRDTFAPSWGQDRAKQLLSSLCGKNLD